MPDREIPKFRFYKEGEQISSVDPEDLKRRNNKPWTKEALLAAQRREIDSSAVSRRNGMIEMLKLIDSRIYNGQLLAPWRHGEELDYAVFRVAAAFPIRELRHGAYMTAGDEIFGFDPNAFVQQLIEKTGIPHVWEPISTRIDEGGWSYSRFSVQRDAGREARDLLWAIWSRFANPDRLLSHSDELPFSDQDAFRLVMMLVQRFRG
jgi:hypothetical protein